jgi:hypothetical protein
MVGRNSNVSENVEQNFCEDFTFEYRIGGRKMKLGKFFLVLGLLATFAFAAPGFQTWAGNPPPSLTIVGPEYWGSLVIRCNDNIVTIKVKRVVDCNVRTQSLTMTWPVSIGCPIDENELIHQYFGNSGILFGEPGTPIITKVKHFKLDSYSSGSYIGDVYSADVQIQFCTDCP